MNYVSENKLNSFIKKKKIKNILIITGKKSFNFSGFKKLGIYQNFKSIINIFYKKNEIPKISELKFLIKKINIITPDLIIALGGGCAIDYAKFSKGQTAISLASSWQSVEPIASAWITLNKVRYAVAGINGKVVLLKAA